MMAQFKLCHFKITHDFLFLILSHLISTTCTIEYKINNTAVRNTVSNTILKYIVLYFFEYLVNSQNQMEIKWR